MGWLFLSAFAIALSQLGVALVLMVKAEIRNAKRTDCRVCHVTIKPGGHAVTQLGLGFCPRCAAEVMRRVRESK